MLEVDHARRTPTRAHHSATHLLHEALRQVLGPHVAQKGSLVEPGRLRFDFSHPKPMTGDEIRKVEDLVNAMILQNAPVETHLMTPDQAIAQGALALFGEKYGEEVRVVSMGVDPDERARGPCLLDRALRRHPCAADRRYRPAQDRERGGGRLRRAPRRGADRRCRARLSRYAS